jgi:O-antigen/teichoic acid export membrane protein
MLMGYADVVIVKHFFDATQAGIYSAASLGGKILFFLVGFIPTVLLPQAADRHARGERTQGVLLASCCMLGFLAVCGLLSFRVLGIVLLHALVGHAYDAAQELLIWYGSAMALLALTNVLGSYGIATHRLAFSVSALLVTIGTLLIIAFYHPSLLSVVKTLFFGNLVTAVAVAATLGWQGMQSQAET